MTTGQAICLRLASTTKFPPNPVVSPRRESQPVQSGTAGGRATIHLTARRSRKLSHPAWQFGKEALFTINASYLRTNRWPV